MGEADITQRLIAMREGRPGAFDDLVPVVYDSLRAMAHRRLGANSFDRTLDTTSLVHEAYLRLFDQTRLELRDRHHFFAVAAIAMRQIVIDHARRRRARKRGGDLARVPLAEGQIAIDRDAELLLSLDEALRRLSSVSERLARVVELRYFAGLTVEETAAVVGVDARTVKRDWRKARALLYEALEAEREAEGRDPSET